MVQGNNAQSEMKYSSSASAKLRKNFVPLQKIQRNGEVLAKYSGFNPNVGLEEARTSPPGTL